MSDEQILVNNADIPKGVLACYKNSKSLYNSAKLLYQNEHYQMSIVTAILSIEEIRKCHNLEQKWIWKENISKQFWKKLNEHEFKLVESPKKHIKNFIETVNDTTSIFNPMQTMLQNMLPEAEKNAKEQVEWSRSLLKLKLKLLYIGLDNNNNWEHINLLNKNIKKNIATFVLYKTEIEINTVAGAITFILDSMKINIIDVWKESDIIETNMLNFISQDHKKNISSNSSHYMIKKEYQKYKKMIEQGKIEILKIYNN